MKEYDPNGVDARAIEAAIEGVHVIRHGKCRLTVTRHNSLNSSYLIILLVNSLDNPH